jgi:hypothetical protein
MRRNGRHQVRRESSAGPGGAAAAGACRARCRERGRRTPAHGMWRRRKRREFVRPGWQQGQGERRLPGPGPVQPTGPSGTDDGTAEGDQKGELRESAPPADYLSTFALDVDTASYGYARRTLEEGRRPDPSTVRPEEFINSFGQEQDYERPDGNGFTVTVDGARTAPRTVRVGEEDATPTRSVRRTGTGASSGSASPPERPRTPANARPPPSPSSSTSPAPWPNRAASTWSRSPWA